MPPFNINQNKKRKVWYFKIDWFETFKSKDLSMARFVELPFSLYKKKYKIAAV